MALCVSVVAGVLRAWSHVRVYKRSVTVNCVALCGLWESWSKRSVILVLLYINHILTSWRIISLTSLTHFNAVILLTSLTLYGPQDVMQCNGWYIDAWWGHGCCSGGSGVFILGATGVATLSSGGHTTNTVALNYRICNRLYQIIHINYTHKHIHTSKFISYYVMYIIRMS